MESYRILGIFVLLAIAIAMTLGMFNRIKKKSQQSQSQSQPALPAPSRASYTLAPPFVNPYDDKPEDYYDGGIGPYSSFGDEPPAEPTSTMKAFHASTKKPCGCQAGKK